MALRNSACRFKNLRAPLMRSCAPTHNSRTQFQKSSRAVFGNISARRSLIQANCFRLLPPTFKSAYGALVIRIIGSFNFCRLWKNGTLKRRKQRPRRNAFKHKTFDWNTCRSAHSDLLKQATQQNDSRGWWRQQLLQTPLDVWHRYYPLSKVVWFSCFVALMFARLASAQRFFDFCFFDFRSLSLSDSSELLDLLLLSPLLELGELLLLLSSEESLLSVVDESSDSDSSLLSLLSLSLPTETVRDKSIHLHSKYIAICSPSTPPFFFTGKVVELINYHAVEHDGWQATQK